MDCLRSFNFGFKGAATYSPGGAANFKIWANGTEKFFAIDIDQDSIIFPQGFKNINIYGIEMIGSVQTNVSSAAGGCLVDDFSFEIQLTGNFPIINTVKTTDYWEISNLNDKAKTFTLSKNTNKVTLLDPIASVTEIKFNGMHVQGSGAQNGDVLALNWHLNFVFYYQYEGEEIAFL
jgi:hypothetical protein